MKSVYFFDTYEFTRWFDDRLLWDYVPGDNTTVPDRPCIGKSRPIAGDNANLVLLNLDKVRHFVFLKDDIPFRAKRDKAIFQLDINYKPHRRRFMERYFGSPICDAGIIAPRPEYPSEWTKPRIGLYDHLSYKFILAIEGNDVATNLKWIMSSNSVAVMPRPTYETWFMEGRLVPDYHYIRPRRAAALLHRPSRTGRGDHRKRPPVCPAVPRPQARKADRAAGAGSLFPLHGTTPLTRTSVRRPCRPCVARGRMRRRSDRCAGRGEPIRAEAYRAGLCAWDTRFGSPA